MNSRDMWREPPKNIVEYLKLATKFVDQQSDLLAAFLSVLTDEFLNDLASRSQGDRAQRIAATGLLAHGVARNSKAIRILLSQSDLDSSYILARALIERVVNYNYLLRCEDAEFEKWMKHSYQKAYRLLTRTIGFAGGNVLVSSNTTPDPSLNSELEDSLNLFTGRKGGEITRWTQLSLEKRVIATHKRYSRFKARSNILLIGVTSLYDLASEAMHGTLIGASFPVGSLIPQMETLENHVFSLLLHTGLSLNTIIWMGSDYAELKDVHSSANEDFDSLMESIGCLIPKEPENQESKTHDISVKTE